MLKKFEAGVRDQMETTKTLFWWRPALAFASVLLLLNPAIGYHFSPEETQVNEYFEDLQLDAALESESLRKPSTQVILSSCSTAAAAYECHQIKNSKLPCKIVECKAAMKHTICTFNYLNNTDICPTKNTTGSPNPNPTKCVETTSGECFRHCQSYKSGIEVFQTQAYEFTEGVGKSYRCQIVRREGGKNVNKTVCGCTAVGVPVSQCGEEEEPEEVDCPAEEEEVAEEDCPEEEEEVEEDCQPEVTTTTTAVPQPGVG